MKLQIIFILHGVITFAAGTVLIVNPGLIPSTVDIKVSESQYLLYYFLAAAEISIAYLSFASRKISDPQALKAVLTTFIIFHAVTALLELYVLTQGVSPKIPGNIVLRMIVVTVFSYFRFKLSAPRPTP